ncbi:MAG: MBL fold metallo-hydrolase [Pirellulales bacterium]|nr:MBL fold metallo-hydrolase [Pirellulales bacterium]
MKKKVKTVDFTGQLIFLGTGTSVGVPAVGCPCDVCGSQNPKDKRLRASVILGLPEGNLLIDTTPDLRTQLLRENIGVVNAVVFTHEHTDHLMGLDDLRLFPFYLGHSVPLYCEEHVEDRIRKSFDYAFSDQPPSHAGAVPQLEFCRIQPGSFSILGAELIGFRLEHGKFSVLGFKIGKIAYCTDTNGIPEETWPLLEGLDVLVLDALQSRPHPTHFCVEESLAVIEKLRPRQAYLTHICHDLEHEKTEADLPDGVALAFDGLRIPLN